MSHEPDYPPAGCAGHGQLREPVHGHQEGAAYNGHFKSVCYHPLFCFNQFQFGDCEGAPLRPGSVHSADRWREMLEPFVEWYSSRSGVRLLYRADAAFAKPEVYEYLDQRGIGYAMRLPATEVLQRQIEPLLQPPIEKLLEQPIVRYHDFLYQAGSWDRPRRVVAKAE